MWTASEEAYLHPITLMLGAHFFWQPDKFKCKFQLYLWTHTLQFDHVHLWLPLRQLSTLKFAAQERSFHKKTQLCETSLVRTHLKPPPWEMETRWYFTQPYTLWIPQYVCNMYVHVCTFYRAIWKAVLLYGAVDGIRVGGIPTGLIWEMSQVHLIEQMDDCYFMSCAALWVRW